MLPENHIDRKSRAFYAVQVLCDPLKSLINLFLRWRSSKELSENFRQRKENPVRILSFLKVQKEFWNDLVSWTISSLLEVKR